MNFQKEQEKLAQKIGVKIEDYPAKAYFPVGYYDTILQPGMTLQQVHNKITEYQRVLHCENFGEVYYYFSKDDSKALRFMVLYDDELKYKSIQSEDEDSRNLNTFNCTDGLIRDS